MSGDEERSIGGGKRQTKRQKWSEREREGERRVG